MLKFSCPYCGTRAETEFAHGGEAHIRRPAPTTDDRDWAEYLFLRENPKGWTRERWRHVAGCGRWFNLLRNTATDAVGPAYKLGVAPPSLPSDADDGWGE